MVGPDSSLLAIWAAWLPANAIAAGGWLLMMDPARWPGGPLVLGFELLRFPDGLDDPLSPGRMALIGLHVALIVTGLSLAALALIGH